jgi:hypothetical protein
MNASLQIGLLTLQKLWSTGPQKVTVQHVHVNSGGQAVVRSLRTGGVQDQGETAAVRLD